jgi:hypothetical protein
MYHPHDMTRVIRFKMKYRFWGTALEGTRQVFCQDETTEALTSSGWKRWDNIEDDDKFLVMDPVTREVRWEEHTAVNVFDWDGSLTRWQTDRMDALSTPNHRWLVEYRDRDGYSYPNLNRPIRFMTTEELSTGHSNKQIIGAAAGGHLSSFAEWPTFSDDFVELIGWAVTEGHYPKFPAKTAVTIGQSEASNPNLVARIRYLQKAFSAQGATATELNTDYNDGTKYEGCRQFYFGSGIGNLIRQVAPNKTLTPEFLGALTMDQAELLYHTLLEGDGHYAVLRNHDGFTRTVETENFINQDQGLIDGFQMLTAMLGRRSFTHWWKSDASEWWRQHKEKRGDLNNCANVTVYHSPYITARRLHVSEEGYQGKVWCPTTPSGTWFARRNGCTYWTGNSFTELWTESSMQSFINDELVEDQENPLGRIPFVHIANKKVPSSPWGLSDIQDITDLNRAYNETATLLMDITNYYACVDETTLALTPEGWKKHDELTVGDEILTLNSSTDEIEWQPVESLFSKSYTGSLVHLSNHIDALVTPNHRWLVEQRKTRKQIYPLDARRIGRTLIGDAEEPALADFKSHARLVVGGGTSFAFAAQPKWDDELVETVGWYITEGCDAYSGPNDWHSITISQSWTKNPDHVRSIRRLMRYWQRSGGTFTESAKPMDNGCYNWYLGKGVKETLEEVAPKKVLSPSFIYSLTYTQARMLQKILVDADGHWITEKRSSWYQEDGARKEGYRMLNAMLGDRVNTRGNFIDKYSRQSIEVESTLKSAKTVDVEDVTVWCPTVKNSIWMASRNGNTYWTGNSPTTVIMGAKSNSLERGPKKVWSIPNEKAKIENLALGAELGEAIKFLELLKEKMHELVGVPISLLGQEQQISNTSGVALSLQYLPLMQKFRQKTTQMSSGLAMLNELLILTAATYLPQMLEIDPLRDPPLEEGQVTVLDPNDPITYRNTVEFQSPLPLDMLVLLNELQLKMGMGLESKTGALRLMGEQYPAEKLQELMDELHQDALEQGALDLQNAQIRVLISMLTGVPPDGADPPSPSSTGPAPGGDAGGVSSAGGPGVNTAAGVQAPPPQFADTPEVQSIMNQLTTLAAGTKIPQRRNPLSSGDDD